MAEKIKVDLISVNTKKTEQSTDSLKKRIKELRLELEQLDVTSAEFAEKSNELGNLMHQNSEITRISRQAMNDFGSTMTNITQVAGGVTGAVQGVVAGLSLMGVEVAKDDIGMIKLMTALQGLAQSFTLVDTGVKGMKGLMQALDANLMKVLAKTAATIADTSATEANTAATVKNTAATAANATAQGEQAAAQAASAAGAVKGAKSFGTLSSVFANLLKVINKFKASLGLAALAIAAVTVVLNKAVKTYKEHRKEIEENVKQIERLKNATAETDISFKNLQAAYMALTSDSEKSKFIEERASDMTKLGMAINNVNEADKAFISQSKEYLKALEDKSKAEKEVTHSQEQQLENIQRINKISAQLQAEGILDSKGNIRYGKKISIDDEKKSVKEWMKLIEELKNENNKLIESFTNGSKNISDATSRLRKIDGGEKAKTASGSVKDWVAELKTALSDADSLYIKAVDNAMELTEKLRMLYGNEYITKIDRYIKQSDSVFDKYIKDNLKDGNGNIVELFGEWYGENMKKGMKTFSDEGYYDYFAQTTEGAYVDMFDKIANKLRTEGTAIISTALSEGFERLYPKMEKILAEIYGTTEEVFNKITGPNSIFNQEALNLLDAQINDEINKIADAQAIIKEINKKPSLTAYDKKRLTEEQKNLETLKLQNEETLRISQAVSEIAEKYKEMNNDQRSMFLALENLKFESKRITESAQIERDYFKALTEGVHEFGAEYNKALAEYNKAQAYSLLEIQNSETLIQQYERELNAYDTTTDRKIELMSLLMQEQDTLERKQRESSMATYEFNTKLIEQYYNRYDEAALKIINGEGLAKGMFQSLTDMIFGKQEDWNKAAFSAEQELEAVNSKMKFLAEWRRQNIISEGEYQQRLAELTKERTEKELAYERAAAERKTKIWQTSFEAYEETQGNVLGFLSVIQQRYNENSEQYKNIQRYSIIADTISGAMAAYRSGIESMIPWPGNMILGAANAGIVVTTGIAQLNNLKSNRIGTISPSASNAASTDRYETLANANNQAELMGSIRDSRVWVSESDIRDVSGRVNVYESESRW